MSFSSIGDRRLLTGTLAASLNLRAQDHQWVEVLWREYAQYADLNFTKEFPQHLQPRFWEMYLACCILGQGLNVVPRKSRTCDGPDVRVELGNQTLWIEAIAPEAGTGPDAVPQIEVGSVHPVPDIEITLRYCRAIATKFEKFEKYLKKRTVHRNDACVIAVSGGAIPNRYTEAFLPRILHALFPLGQYAVTIDQNTLQVIEEGHLRRDYIRKVSGRSVGTGFFLDPDHAQVSGVLFSYADPWNRPDPGRDFIFCHNPSASQPLPRGWLPVGQEYWLDGSTLRGLDWGQQSGCGNV